MKFVCYSDWKQLPQSANVLCEFAARKNIFFSRHWFESLATSALEDNQAIVLACVIADDKLMAILPLIKETGNTWYALRHRYTPHFSLLIGEEAQDLVLECLAAGLSQLSISALLLEPVPGSTPLLNAFQIAMESAGFHCDHFFRHYNWIYHVQGQTYAAYLANRPAKLRNTILRKGRKLDREHGYEIRLYSGLDVVDKMSDYYTVYNASWKANEQYPGLVEDMVGRFSSEGWTRLGVLYIQGKPVAAQLWFVCHAKASIFRLSYDEAWKQYSPGSILTSYLMQQVIDVDKVGEIDFLTGNDAYKQDWMSERRERFALSCVKSRPPLNWYKKLMKIFNIEC